MNIYNPQEELPNSSLRGFDEYNSTFAKPAMDALVTVNQIGHSKLCTAVCWFYIPLHTTTGIGFAFLYFLECELKCAS